MLRLSREVHCALADIKVESFKTLQRYGWLPSLPPYLRPSKPFAPIETLTLALYNAMYEQHHISRVYAADICSAAHVLVSRWNALRETAAERRQAGKQEILFGRVMRLPNEAEGERLPAIEPVVGTLEEINLRHRTTISLIAVSVTRVSNVVSNRAMKHGVDLDLFWSEPTSAKRSSAQKPSRAKKGSAR
jgi:hypothetical protein